MATFAMISCTKKKKDYKCKAAEMYSESPWFQRACKFASLAATQTFILSAKHGLLPKETKYSQVKLDFAEIENILGFNLPASASRHRAWWGMAAMFKPMPGLVQDGG